MNPTTDFETILSSTFDIDAREAEIIGQPQRIESLSADKLSPEARELVTKVRQSLDSNTTSVSDIFGLMLQHPGLFQCQMDTSLQLAGRGALSRRDRELAVLRVAWWCRAPYEWGEHVRVAKRYGFTDEEIARIKEGSSAPQWNDHERAILRGVEELLGDQMITDATWEVLARSWNNMQLIEFPYLVGQYFLTALQQNSLRVRLDASNIGLRQC